MPTNVSPRDPHPINSPSLGLDVAWSRVFPAPQWESPGALLPSRCQGQSLCCSACGGANASAGVAGRGSGQRAGATGSGEQGVPANGRKHARHEGTWL